MNNKIVGSLVGILVVAGIGTGVYFAQETKETAAENLSFDMDFNVSVKEGKREAETMGVKGMKLGYDINNQQMYVGVDEINFADIDKSFGKLDIIMDKNDYYFYGDKKYSDDFKDDFIRNMNDDEKKIYGSLFESFISGKYTKINIADEFIEDLGEIGKEELVKTYIIGSFMLNGMKYFEDEDFFNKLKNRILKKGSYEKFFTVVREDEGKKYLELKEESCDYIKVLATGDITIYALSDEFVSECKKYLPEINEKISKTLYLTTSGDYDKLNIGIFGSVEYGKGEIKEAEASIFGQGFSYKEKVLSIYSALVSGKIDFTNKEIIKGDLKLIFGVVGNKNYVKGNLVFEGDKKIDWDVDLFFEEEKYDGGLQTVTIKGSGNRKKGNIIFDVDSEYNPGYLKFDYEIGKKDEYNIDFKADEIVMKSNIEYYKNNLKIDLDMEKKDKNNLVGDLDFTFSKNFPFLEKAESKLEFRSDIDDDGNLKLDYDGKDFSLVAEAINDGKTSGVVTLIGEVNSNKIDLVGSIIDKEDKDNKLEVFFIDYFSKREGFTNDFDFTFKTDKNGNGKSDSSDIEFKINGKIKVSLFNMVSIPKKIKEIKVLEIVEKLGDL